MFEAVTFTHLVKILLAFHAPPKVHCRVYKTTTTGSYPEPDESSPNSPILVL
jgi:hypothetical protein